jgi:hypothetical protein
LRVLPKPVARETDVFVMMGFDEEGITCDDDDGADDETDCRGLKREMVEEKEEVDAAVADELEEDVLDSEPREVVYSEDDD